MAFDPALRPLQARLPPTGGPLKKTLVEFDALLSNEKIKRLLGFKQQHDWRCIPV